MPRVRCHYIDCVFLDQGYCAAAAAVLDPDSGCLTYSPSGEISPDEAWRENESLEEEWENAGFGAADDSDDLWLDVVEGEEIPEDIKLDELEED